MAHEQRRIHDCTSNLKKTFFNPLFDSKSQSLCGLKFWFLLHQLGGKCHTITWNAKKWKLKVTKKWINYHERWNSYIIPKEKIRSESPSNQKAIGRLITIFLRSISSFHLKLLFFLIPVLIKYKYSKSRKYRNVSMRMLFSIGRAHTVPRDSSS